MGVGLNRFFSDKGRSLRSFYNARVKAHTHS
jgi:hypothetical protein